MSVVDSGNEVARLGEMVELGGAEYGEADSAFLRTSMNGDLPEQCRIGSHWLVVDVGP